MSTGSATALLRTVVGSVLRPLGGWMSAAGTVELMADLGIPEATARSSLTRLCAREVLRREPRDGVAGYVLDPAAEPMLERGDARIFGDRAPGNGWCLVSFSFPEGQRLRRHQLRRRLAALGCGSVADGLWIGPSTLESELAETAAAFDAELFVGAEPAGDLSARLARWYDLGAIKDIHLSFLASFRDVGTPADDREAFVLWVRVLDAWRVIPYRDPGFPVAALPTDWPGPASADLFARLRTGLADRAVAHAARVAAPAASTNRTAPAPR